VANKPSTSSGVEDRICGPRGHGDGIRGSIGLPWIKSPRMFTMRWAKGTG